MFLMHSSIHYIFHTIWELAQPWDCVVHSQNLCIDEQRKRSRLRSKFACHSWQVSLQAVQSSVYCVIVSVAVETYLCWNCQPCIICRNESTLTLPLPTLPLPLLRSFHPWPSSLDASRSEIRANRWESCRAFSPIVLIIEFQTSRCRWT